MDDFCNFELSAKYWYDEFLTKNPHLPPSRSAPSGKNGGRTPLRSLVFSLSLCCRDVSVRTSAPTTVRAAVCTQPTIANLITVTCHLCRKERTRTKSRPLRWPPRRVHASWLSNASVLSGPSNTRCGFFERCVDDLITLKGSGNTDKPNEMP